MEQLTTKMGVSVLHSEAESKTKSLSFGGQAIRQPGWPGDSKRTGTSSRQPKIEVVRVTTRRCERTQKSVLQLDCLYFSGIRRTITKYYLDDVFSFIEQRYNYEVPMTSIIVSPEFSQLTTWLLTTQEGINMVSAFNLVIPDYVEFASVDATLAE